MIQSRTTNRTTRLGFALLLLCQFTTLGSTMPTAMGAQRESKKLLDSFDTFFNEMEGKRNVFQKAPSTATAARVSGARLGRKGLGLIVTADRQEEGYCGIWIHFFDAGALKLKYVDATKYKFLTFWVKGAEGGEQFKVKLADDVWLAKEDSVTIGDIDDFLDEGITRRWQQVFVPLSDDCGLDLEQLGGLTFEFDSPTKTTVFIDQIELTTESPSNKRSSRQALVTNQKSDRLLTEFEHQLQASVRPAKLASERALWLWDTVSILSTPEETKSFVDFCVRNEITTVWAQLPHDVHTKGVPTEIKRSTCTITLTSELRSLLRTAHDAAIRVHALAGDPHYALKDSHHIALAIVDAVIDFNSASSELERFDGVHFDNEPYLLTGWHDWQQRQVILKEFLSLNRECQRRVDAAPIPIEFGVDIPFWLQEADESGQPIGQVMFEGKNQAASYHLLQMVDNIGVMNYRDVAQGPDGMIAHADNLLSYADNISAAKLYFGVETLAPQPTRVVFAVGRSRRDFHEAVSGHASHFAALSHVAGKRLRLICDQDNVHVGIEVGLSNTDEEKAAITTTLSRIASTFGVNAAADPEDATTRQQALQQLLRANVQWRDVNPCTIIDTVTGQTHLLVRGDCTLPDKVTFADESLEHFRLQTHLAEYQFKKHKSFAGLAIHDYRSFKTLLDRYLPPETEAQKKQTLTSKVAK
ncbi:MAG: hypothetical protein WBD20_24610 [Pirellulaceae bacterium]